MPTAAKALFNQANTAFERTLEFLQEITETDPSLCIWFDRDTAWTRAGNMGFSPTQMPRVMTSRSLDRVSGGGMNSIKRTQREIKLEAVRSALDELIFESNLSETEIEQYLGRTTRLRHLVNN